MKNGSILIISNQKETGNKIAEKVKLLRDCDSIKISSYTEAISVLNTSQPSLIILHCAENDNVGIIKEIRSLNISKKVPILFITNTLEEEKLYLAFDNGIDDFASLSDSDSIILMKILLSLHKSILYKKIEINNEIMISANIIDKHTGIYLKEKAPIVLRNFFSNSIENNLENTVFMYLRPLSIDNKRLDMYNIANLLKTIPRGNDIVAYGKASGFYLVLYNAGEDGAKSVHKRIKNALKEFCKIYACAAEITNSFEEMEPILYKTLREQIKDEKEFLYLNNLNVDKVIETIDLKDENGKKFKDFKKEFLNSFEKIVTPVFYQIQTTNTERFKNSETNYYINENESKFSIFNNDINSELTITYPSYIKVIVDIKHYEKDKPELVQRLSYDFEDFSEEKLQLLLDEMLNEYEQKLNLKMMQDEIKNE